MSELVKTMIDDEQDEDEAQEIPLPNVKSSILAKVIEFANHHKTVEAMTDIEKVKWLFRFFGDGEFFFFSLTSLLLQNILTIAKPKPNSTHKNSH